MLSPETAFGVPCPHRTKPGIRELVIGGTPYVVFYRVRGKRVIISTICLGAQRKEL